MKNKILIQHAVAVLVGGYFIVSGFGKMLNMGQLVVTFQSYGVPSFLSQSAILLPPLEIVIGMFVILPATRRTSSTIISMLLIIFTGAYVYAHFFRGVQDCGCSGRFSFLNKNLPQLLFVNAILLALSIFLSRTSRRYGGPVLRWQKLSIIMVAVLLLTTAGVFSIMLLQHGTGKWIEDDAHSTPFSQILSTHKDSTYALFFFDMDCPHCLDAVGNVEALQSEKVVDKVVGYTFGVESKLANFENLFHPNFTTHLISVEKFYTMIDVVPTIAFVKNDTVIYSDEGKVESPAWYEEHVFR